MERLDVSRYADTTQPGQPVPRLRWQSLWGPVCAALCLCAAVVINACSSNPTPAPPPPTGQWTCFQCTGMTLNADGSFAFPQAPGLVGYIYTAISGNPSGKTITLDYTISGYPPTTFVPAPAAGTGPATVRLFMWQKGDDLSCAGQYASYRWWAANGFAVLTFGEQVISAVITPDQWTNCIGQQDAAGFNNATNNLLGIGVTWGAEFYGHGVSATGPATFRVKSFSVQ